MGRRMVAKSHKWLVMTVLFALLGCGNSDERYHIRGKIEYNGQPVASGRVLFEPDTTKGNHGSQGYALIKDGLYDTQEEGCRGAIGGPHLVRINGFDGKVVSENAPFGRPVFRMYKETIDLPKENTELDFDVPRKK